MSIQVEKLPGLKIVCEKDNISFTARVEAHLLEVGRGNTINEAIDEAIRRLSVCDQELQ